MNPHTLTASGAADALPEQIRAACADFHSAAASLAALCLDAIQAAHDRLAPVADEAGAAGLAAGEAFQILADALAAANPPEPIDV